MKKYIIVSSFDPINNDPRTLRDISAIRNSISGLNNYKIIKISPDIINIRYFNPFNSRFINRVINIQRQLYFILRILRNILFYRPKVVFASNVEGLLPSFLAGKIVKAKIIFDAHELYVKYFNRNYDLRSLFYHLLQRYTLRRIDLVICANYERGRIMKNIYKLSVPPLPILNIPLINMETEKHLFLNMPADNYSLSSYLKTKNKVIYTGYINISRGILKFIDAFKYLEDSYSFLILGNGPDSDIIVKYIKENKLQNVFYHSAVPWQEVVRYNRISDLGVLCYSWADPNNVYCSPNKIFEYPQAGVPVISTSQLTIKNIVERYKIGICIPQNKEEDPLYIANMIKSIITNKMEYKNNLSNILKNYKWENEQKKLELALNNLIDFS